MYKRMSDICSAYAENIETFSSLTYAEHIQHTEDIETICDIL